MINILPQPIAGFQAVLDNQTLGQWPATPAVNVPADAPFVQLAYDELDGAEVDAILGYATIPQANAPVGVPGEFVAYSPQEGWLVFPLSGLAAHLRQLSPGLQAAYEQAGSFEAYAESISGEMSARDYLILGTLETIAFCLRHRLALQIRW